MPTDVAPSPTPTRRPVRRRRLGLVAAVALAATLTAGALATARAPRSPAALATTTQTTTTLGAAAATRRPRVDELAELRLGDRLPARLDRTDVGEDLVLRAGLRRPSLEAGGLGHPRHLTPLVRQDQGDDAPLLPRTRGAPGAVEVVLLSLIHI